MNIYFINWFLLGIIVGMDIYIGLRHQNSVTRNLNGMSNIRANKDKADIEIRA